MSQPAPSSSLQLPAELAERIRVAGARPRKEKVRAFILELCAWRPLAARELADALCRRDPGEFVRAHLGPTVASGELAYSVPEMPNHPYQRYLVPTTPDELDKG